MHTIYYTMRGTHGGDATIDFYQDPLKLLDDVCHPDFMEGGVPSNHAALTVVDPTGLQFADGPDADVPHYQPDPQLGATTYYYLLVFQDCEPSAVFFRQKDNAEDYRDNIYAQSMKRSVKEQNTNLIYTSEEIQEFHL